MSKIRERKQKKLKQKLIPALKTHDKFCLIRSSTSQHLNSDFFTLLSSSWNFTVSFQALIQVDQTTFQYYRRNSRKFLLRRIATCVIHQPSSDLHIILILPTPSQQSRISNRNSLPILAAAQRYTEITHDPLLSSVAQGILWLSTKRLSRGTIHLNLT